jgi:hypothetical protein
MRVGIIGAGPSGLAAAEALRELGYTDITVLEKRARAGGMSWSFKYTTPDNRELIYEMGSVLPTGSKILRKLFKRYKIHIGKQNLGRDADPAKPFFIKFYSFQNHRFLPALTRSRFGFPYSWALITDVCKLFLLLFRYRHYRKPGYQIPDWYWKELSIPLTQWVKERNFKVLAPLFEMVSTGLTLGNPEMKGGVVAYEAFKLMITLIRFPPRYINRSLKCIKEGYQEIWKRVAESHHVIFNAGIKSVLRKERTVEIDLGDRKLTFDKLIVSASPSSMLDFLDVDEEEKDLFSKVHHSAGWRIAFTAKNLPHDALYLFYEYYLKEKYPDIIYAFYPEGEVREGVWLYSSFLPCPEGVNIEPILKNTEKLFRDHFKAEIIEWVNKKFWSEYRPHFLLEDVKQNKHQDLAKLQGKKNTYYVGGIFAGGTHAAVAEHAYDLVNRHFKQSTV